MKGKTSKQTKTTSDYTSNHAAMNTPARAVVENVTIEPAPVKTGAPVPEGEDKFPEGLGIPPLGLIVPEGISVTGGEVAPGGDVAVPLAPPFALLRNSGNFAPGLIAKTIPALQCVPWAQ